MVEQRPFGYIYKTTIAAGSKVLVYVGKREKSRFTTSYLGSGRLVRKVLSSGRYQTATVELVGYHYSRDELNAAEVALIAAARDEHQENCLNIAIGGRTGGPATFWTLERCKQEALKYKTRTAWQKAGGGSYMSAIKHGWVDICCAHMVELRKPKGSFTLAFCKQDALQYNNVAEWKAGSSRAYQVARENGWLQECCSHMSALRVRRWTRAMCVDDARKFKTFVEWEKHNPSAVNAARNNRWVDECKSHMETIRRSYGYWTLDRCIEDAKKYKTRGEWIRESASAYAVANRAGWLALCCAHMPRPTSIDINQAA